MSNSIVVESPNILVFGATSAIAIATIRRYAGGSASFYLVARDIEKLEVVAQDARVRGAKDVYTRACELNDFDLHPEIIADARRRLSRLDIALIAHGTLQDQKQMQERFKSSEENFKTNFLSVVSLLTALANDFEAAQSGTIAVISSIAGDRGRKSNYIYGSAKAGVSAYLQGLRNRLASRGAHVLTIKPGFVSTPMTAHLKQNFLFATPDTVAKDIVKAINRRRDVIYTPWFWWPISIVIRSIPERIFKKLSL